MKYRLVIADVDGTLIAPGTKKTEIVSSRLLNAVEKLKELGVIFSIATARSLDWVDGIIKSLKLTSPIILDNGATIYDCLVKKNIFNSYLPDAKVVEILSILDKFPFDKYLVNASGRLLYQQENQTRLNNVIKIIVLHITPLQAQEVYETVSQVKEIRVTKSTSGEYPVKESIHITNYDAAKEKALKKIADLSGVNTENILAIGDSYNDYALMSICGFKVAMGNAVAQIKTIADYIAPTYEEDGVAHVLEKFIIKNNV